MLKNERGFTLIELIVIIVIIGILAAVAIPTYIDLTSSAANGTARGILGAIRSANTLMYANRLINGTAGTYSMQDIIPTYATIQGVQSTGLGSLTYSFYVGAYPYTFSLGTYGQAPTTLPSVYSGTATW